jgi:hypothetical protein
LNTWIGWKKDECRSRLFGTDPKEEEILVDQAEGGIHRIRDQANGLILGLEKKKIFNPEQGDTN